ncbi:MAG: hypothetical protein ACREIU_11900 [Planctomycetota bacterium]
MAKQDPTRRRNEEVRSEARRTGAEAPIEPSPKGARLVDLLGRIPPMAMPEDQILWSMWLGEELPPKRMMGPTRPRRPRRPGPAGP